MKRQLGIFLQAALGTLLLAVTPAVGETMPVGDILARHTEALGGAELEKVQTLKVTGTFNFNGIDSAYTIYRQRPDLYRLETTTSRGTFVSGYDGADVWSQGPDRSGAVQVRLIEGDDRQRFVDDNADFDSPLIHAAKKGHKVELVGAVDLDGTPVYHLKLTLASGSEQQWYLSRDDYLPVRKVITAMHRSGPYDRVWYLMEHQKAGGITLPHYLEREDRQHVRAYTVDQVEVGAAIDESLFEMPDPPEAE
ncbi:MAG: hypothetical protein AAF657_11620 [Acidobacteriota bacterium]